jgi:hypothetical protein
MRGVAPGIAHLGTAPAASSTSPAILGHGFAALLVVTDDAYGRHGS